MTEILELGPLRARRVVTPSASAEKDGGNGVSAGPLVCVLLHGFGAPGDDLVSLAQAIAAPPGTVFLFPEAPHALQDFIMQPMLGDSRAWWMIDIAAMQRALARRETRDLSRQVPEGLADARAAVSEMLDAVAADLIRASVEAAPRIVLGGFSQGAMLSLDVALRDPGRSLAGVVLLSGTMLAEHEWTPLMAGRRGMPVFQSHGDSDPILPFTMAERLRDALASAGVVVEFDAFHGPHTIPLRTLERVGAWLRALPG